MSRSQLLIFIGLGVIALLLILILFGVIFGKKAATPAAASITFWGIQDDESAWADVFDKFREIHPEITVNYKRLDENTYEDTLVNALASGRGPDVFMLKNSWITKHKDKVYPLPQDYLKFYVQDFQNNFVDGTAQNLITPDGQILGLPVFFDTLALFYNKDIFNATGVASPPKNWDEVQALVKTLTKTAPNGDLLKSGIALGGAKNMEHLLEIVSALIFQNGNSVINSKTNQIDLGQPASSALSFYGSFSNPQKQNFSWNESQLNSLEAFAEEQTAMVLGFASDISRIQALNPHLNFGVALFPQIAGAKTPLTYGSYFFPAVSKSSPNAASAWQFVLFISSPDGAKLYLQKTNRPPAQRVLIGGQAPAGMDIFYKQALIGRSWPVPDESASYRIFQDAVESVISGGDPGQAANQMREQLQLLLP